MTTDGGTGSVQLASASLRLTADSDEIAHLVCCRDQPWRVAFCGFESDTINMAAEHVCGMCVAEVERLLPDVYEQPSPRCPKDRRLCPTLFEVEKRVMREVSP
ncbi:hypothetical protein [Microbacterium sp. HJ5]